MRLERTRSTSLVPQRTPPEAEQRGAGSSAAPHSISREVQPSGALCRGLPKGETYASFDRPAAADIAHYPPQLPTALRLDAFWLFPANAILLRTRDPNPHRPYLAIGPGVVRHRR
jgi:hypothetical protein